MPTILKEITIRKAIGIRNTTKHPDGSYTSNNDEADVSLTVLAEDGKLDELEVIDRVKQLVTIALGVDPSWIDPRVKEVKKNVDKKKE